MRYKLFGRSGLRVSELCLGTATFGMNAAWGADLNNSRAIFESFANAGGNFIDTAHIYGDGASEKLVGEFIRGDRDHFVVSTKYSPSFGNDLSKAGNSRKNMRRSVDESLVRLGTEYIDLFLLHAWDFSTPMEEVLRGLDDLVSAGKVTYVAASNVEAWRVSSANTLADLRGWAPFIGIQICYNLIERTAERDLLGMAQELDLGVMSWSPLGGGVLSAKYEGSDRQSKGRWADRMIDPRASAIARLVAEIAQELGRTPAQVALAWIRQQSRHSNAIIPVLGARTAAQIEDNIGCLTAVLSVDQVRRLEQASAIDMGQLHSFLTERGPLSARDLAFAGQYDVVDSRARPRLST